MAAPGADLCASLSEDGKILRIYAVNSTTKTLEVRFVLEKFNARVERG